MPKLRNSETNVGQIANWLGRKLRNHNPLNELTKSISERAATPRMYKAKSSGTVHTLKDAENTVIAHYGDGRGCKVIVEELTVDQLEEIEATQELVPCQH